MELVTEAVHGALAYVAALNREGYAPTIEQVEEFATSSRPQAAVYENVMSSATYRSMGTFNLDRFNRLVKQAEPVVDYLARMEWIGMDGIGLRLTDCGSALLRSLGRSEAQDVESVQVTLNPTDPLVYVHLTRLMAAAGTALLADAYFKPEYIPWLFSSTQVARLLVGSRHSRARQDLIELGLALGGMTDDRSVQIRSTDDKRLHDRCLISDDGVSVSVMGTSMNGVGRSLTAVVPLAMEAGLAYRHLYEELWQAAQPVPPLTITKMLAAEQAEASDAQDTAVSTVLAGESNE